MKKISAVMAAIATLLFSVFAFAPSAMAADSYSATITPGTAEGAATITVTIDEATAEAYPYIAVQYDDTEISSVTPVALKTTQWFEVAKFGKNGSNFEKTFKVTSLNCKDAKVTVLGAKDANGTGSTVLQTKTVNFANTCPAGQGGVNTGANTTAQTGASVLPYAVAVVLMAAAGAAMFAVRKNSAR